MSSYKPPFGAGGGGGIVSGLFQLSGTSVAASGAIPDPLFIGTLNAGIINVSGNELVSGTLIAQSGRFTTLNVISGLTTNNIIANNIKYGLFLSSGNNSTTIYNISHSIVSPLSFNITPSSPQARGTPDVSGASGQLIVTYPIAPVSGDVRIGWQVYA